ncbi:MAG: hypothetical protein JWQ01_3469 [Massilia sp.]|nr:hypothetical protein [Massilia sp.]
MSETNTPDLNHEVEWQAILPEPGAFPAEGQPDLILRMQELERQRIAMDLHDDLGPLITLIKLELQNARKFIGAEEGDAGLARAALERAEQNVARAFAELRRTVLDLHPVMLDDLGLLRALEWLVRQFELSGADTVIEAHLDADEQAIPAALKTVLFRICQEALNNVMKHAGASRVKVALAVSGDNLRLLIEDDGSGIAAGSSDIFRRCGGGLPGIVRRANSSHGECSIDTARGRGTRIAVCWRLARGDTAAPDSAAGDAPLASVIAP